MISGLFTRKKAVFTAVIIALLVCSALSFGYKHKKPASEPFVPVSISYDAATDKDVGFSSLSEVKPRQYSVKHSSEQAVSIKRMSGTDSDKANEVKSVINKPIKRDKPKAAYAAVSSGSGTGNLDDLSNLTAKDLAGMSETELIDKMGPVFTAIQKESGILASVNLAQFILESGYSRDEIAVSANNMFGMKTVLSDNTWSGSTWDNVSMYVKDTKEQDILGTGYEVVASFRAYPSIKESLSDHTAYLLRAYNGDFLRYVGLKGNTDYKSVAMIIKNGGYGTDVSYADKLCNLIEKWDLTRFDLKPDI